MLFRDRITLPGWSIERDAMRIVSFGDARERAIEDYESIAATAVPIASGRGATRVYRVRFAPGGRIGRHVAGFPQLFLIVEGSGWATGGDGLRVDLLAGQGAVFDKGESHEKGSDEGATAIMIQIEDLELHHAAG
ncbi:MAG: cupin domain-containing protein [Candidatus Eisenbacteria bacterium]